MDMASMQSNITKSGWLYIIIYKDLVFYVGTLVFNA